jgi:hypothetical protein
MIVTPSALVGAPDAEGSALGAMLSDALAAALGDESTIGAEATLALAAGALLFLSARA